MGDRGNIVVRQGKSSADDVWIYTHWSGCEIQETVAKALARQQRWNDPSYLARIVFCELCTEPEGETGFGISCRVQDNEYPICVVDIPGQRVFLIEESELDKNGRIPAKYQPKESRTFAEVSGAQLLKPDVTIPGGTA